MQLKTNDKCDDKIPTTFGQIIKGKIKWLNKDKGKSNKSNSKPGKDMNQIKCFTCHKHNHYTSYCLDKESKGKQ